MEKPQQRLTASRVFAGLAILFVFLAGWILGSYSEQVKVGLDMSKFWHVYSLVKSKYPGEIDEKKAVDGAIQGLVGSLNDPYSSFLNEEEKTRLEEDLSGRFEGIGAILTQKDGQTVVVEPLEGSPALRAGVKKDDVILAVDGELTEGLVLDEVVAKIRGPKGEKVKLTLLREKKELELEIERDTISVESVEYEKSGDIGIIRVSQFGTDTYDGIKQAIGDLEQQGAAKYLIDLRDNPGGYLNVVARVSGFFLPPGSVVVQEKYQGGATDEIKTTELPLVPEKPVFVFINGGSASASEILAGALKDHGRAVLLGEKSFGKGSVQDILNLRGNTALRLTIAEWLTPKGGVINKKGIEPDQKITADTAEKELSAALSYIRSTK
jgi:carboxyl-terminal processing protease